ncbi:MULTISPECIES: hypothetical protein [unclassified Aureispira]|uniref:hypothetical protein n=1 Tax=unclassified Aureispira TaxID=2649989 RepID=UPI0006967790|nr:MULTISPECIES: hypothetical protein [unclassified Aureispira]WMX13068.1 hypothetical protein QP953_19700 [Aureispira sp. CCB-E]
MRNSNAGRDHQLLSEASFLYIIAGLLLFIFLISCTSEKNSNQTPAETLSDSTTISTIKDTISKKKRIYLS